MAAYAEDWTDPRGFECTIEGDTDHWISATATRLSDGVVLRLERRNPVLAKRYLTKLIGEFLETGRTTELPQKRVFAAPHSHPSSGLLTATAAYRSSLGDEACIVGNHTGYKGGENYEHDDNGSLMNFSGVEDDMLSAEANHNGWDDGYDY
jgi:hypothetical protein